MSTQRGADDDLPPPYTESCRNGKQQVGTISAPLRSDTVTVSLAAHLHLLPDRMRASEQARSVRTNLVDLELVTHIIPYLETFLVNLGSNYVRLKDRRSAWAELTIVPSSAVSKAWELSGASERRREGEKVEMVRVEIQNKIDARGNKDAQGVSAMKRTTNDETWWWQDEGLARRLAAYLEPGPQSRLKRTQVQAPVRQNKEEKKVGWLWPGRKSGEQSLAIPNICSQQSATAVTTATQSFASDGRTLQRLRDVVTMVVRAEEVTFRHENDFGLWESSTGFGLVVTVQVRC